MMDNVVGKFISITLCTALLISIFWTPRNWSPIPPDNLTREQLLRVLTQRGVLYGDDQTVTELSHFIKTTGNLTEAELSLATRPWVTPVVQTFGDRGQFHGAMSTLNQVHVVQIVRGRNTFMTSQGWLQLTRTVSRLGIDVAVFNCKLDSQYCESVDWTEPRLLLVHGAWNGTNMIATVRSYTDSPDSNSIIRWLSESLSRASIKPISSFDQLKNNWLTYGGDEHVIRVVLVNAYEFTPMFYSVLSVCFQERAWFGIINVSEKHVHGDSKLPVPCLLVIMPEQTYIFGTQPGEYHTYDSMALFLKTLQPTVSELCLVALVPLNIIAIPAIILLWLIGDQDLVTRNTYMFRVILVLNSFLFLVVIIKPVFPLVEIAINWVIRRVATTHFMAVLREMWLLL